MMEEKWTEFDQIVFEEAGVNTEGFVIEEEII